MKKSTFKKVFAFMLALVLAFAMSVPAFAATKGDGTADYTITITPGDYTDTSKTDRYKAYEIFTGDLTTTPSNGSSLTDDEKNQLSNIQWGEDINVSALITELTKTGNAFNDAFNSITTMEASLQASAVAKILDNITHPATVTPETKAAAEAFAKAFAIAVKASLKDVCTVEGAHTHEADKSHPVSSTYDAGTKEFKISLDKSGYYLVVDNPSNDPAVGKGDIISEHILEVVRDKAVTVKSATPTVDKEIVSGNSGYEIGQTIKYQLVGTLAENFKNFVGDYKYKFVDTMSKGLTLDEDSIEVKVYSLKADGSLDAEITTITLTKGDTAPNGNYTVSVTGGGSAATVITIAFDNLKEIEGLLADYVIVVTYEAYIDSNAVIGTPGTNAAKVEFSNDPYTDSSTTETPEDKVGVETLELDVVKKDSVSGAGLSGVKFKLYKVETLAQPATGTKNVYGKFTSDDAGTYTLNATDSWTDTKASGTDLITITDGVLKIKGLGTGIYYLEEVETPNGYNALPGPIKIEITATYVTADDVKAAALEGKTLVEGELKTVTAAFTIDGKETSLVIKGTETTLGIIPIEILNIPISSLPSTGGIGNYIFYIGGGLLIVAAIAILIVSKKKATKN